VGCKEKKYNDVDLYSGLKQEMSILSGTEVHTIFLLCMAFLKGLRLSRKRWCIPVLPPNWVK